MSGIGDPQNGPHLPDYRDMWRKTGDKWFCRDIGNAAGTLIAKGKICAANEDGAERPPDH
jgi:hypothetical protein